MISRSGVQKLPDHGPRWAYGNAETGNIFEGQKSKVKGK